jgi:hypothetical protein
MATYDYYFELKLLSVRLNILQVLKRDVRGIGSFLVIV